MRFQSIEPKRYIYQVAQEAIKNYIIDNDLKPGDPLPPEVELTRIFNVSRTSIREAVKSLESLGIIEARSGSGLFVSKFSFESLLDHFGYGIAIETKDLLDLLHVRFTLESNLIEDAVKLVDDEQLQEMRALLDRMHHDALNGEYVPNDDRLFHKILWKNVDNALMQKILDVFWAIFYQARKRTILPDPEDLLKTYERHHAIFEALQQRDKKAARRCMLDHEQGIRRRIEASRHLPEVS